MPLAVIRAGLRSESCAGFSTGFHDRFRAGFPARHPTRFRDIKGIARSSNRSSRATGNTRPTTAGIRGRARAGQGGVMTATTPASGRRHLIPTSIAGPTTHHRLAAKRRLAAKGRATASPSAPRGVLIHQPGARAAARAAGAHRLARGRGEVIIPRQSRGLSFVSRSKRLGGAANATPRFLDRLKAAHQFHRLS